MYEIKDYSQQQAQRLGVLIVPSRNPKYKIDVFDSDRHFITSIGARGYSDYPTYILTRGLVYANNRRRLYKIRHNNDRNVIHSRGWYSDQILW